MGWRGNCSVCMYSQWYEGGGQSGKVDIEAKEQAKPADMWGRQQKMQEME